MIERNLKQVDILKLTLPYCKKHGVKMNKSDISQYVSGKVEPNQDKLFVLSNALNVNEAWLMGYDAPMERSTSNTYTDNISFDTIAFEITGKSLKYSPFMFKALCASLKNVTSNSSTFTNGKRQINEILELMYDSSISYDVKADMLRAIIDLVLYDVKKEELTVHYYLSESNSSSQQSTFQEINLNLAFSKLNYSGKKKVIEYATDLSNLPFYAISSEVSTPYIDAAHTDETATDAEKEASDNLMKDDSEWK